MQDNVEHVRNLGWLGFLDVSLLAFSVCKNRLWSDYLFHLNVMKKLLLTLSILWFASFAGFAADIKAGQFVDVVGGKNDFYAAGSTVSLSSAVEWDLRSASNSIMIDKSISQDLNLAGNMISINASVGDDLKIAGNQVTLNSSVNWDVIVFANTIVIWKDVIIWGDLIAGGANIIMQGSIKGNAKLYAWNLQLGWTIANNANIRSNSISLGSWAKIAGMLDYTSKEKNPSLEAIASGAVFHEDVLGNKRDQNKQYLQENKKWIIAWIIWAIITFKFLSLLATSLILWFLFKHRYGRAAEVVKAEPWKSFWIGVATLIGLPIVWALLLSTWVLAAFGWLLLAAWVFTLLFIEVALILVIMGRLHQTYNKNNKIRKDLLRLVLLSLVCALISGIDAFFGIFAIWALFMLKKDSRNKIMSDYYPVKKSLK